jgi:predicted permease
MLQDLRFALRLFARDRGFFATAVLTIALGIGLSATVFAVVDGVLFRALPYRDADRLVAVYGAIRAENQWSLPVSGTVLREWRERSHALSQIEGYDLGTPLAIVRGAGEAAQARSAPVTSGFFELLGIQAAIGRTLLAEDYASGATPVAVISHRLWRGAFGGDAAVLGKTIDRGGEAFTVVGVLPRDFVFPAPQRRFAPDVLVPFPSANMTTAEKTGGWLFLIGRLTDGASLAQAQADMNDVARRGSSVVRQPQARPMVFDGATVMDLRDQLTRSTRTVLWLVFGAVAAVFAIACVNLVGLLLAHAEDRRRELAVRAAIGAGRAILLRQLLVEAGVLTLAGGAAGWLLTSIWFDAIRGRIPAWLQLLGEPRLDGRVAAFAGALGALILIFAGIVPALRASGGAPHPALAAGTRQSHASRRGRHALIMVEVALATVLLAAGSIMLRSWVNLQTQDTGMDADRVIAVRALPAGPTDAARRAAFNARIAEAIRRVPGVDSVDFVDMPLLQRARRGSSFVPPAEVPNPAGMDTDLNVTPGYFSTMGIRVLLGRALRPEDRDRAVVISQALASRYWPGRNPVGTVIRYGNGTRQIVGVVSSARDTALDDAPMPTLYHVWNDANSSVATVVLRFSGPAARVMPEIRSAVRAADSGAPITMLATVDELLSTSVAERNFNTLLFGVFAVAGLLVALVGIYGLVAFIVARREREMGIRLALGASGRGLELFVMSGTLRWVAGGLLVGLGASVFFARSLRPFVYRVPENDPWTLGVAALGFLAVAAAAAYIPARRAARLDPMIALRAE